MNIFEKIKKFLFGEKSIKELPEQVQNYSKQDKNIIFREDGSQFVLTPMIDIETGEQLCEKVWSEYEKTVKNIPVFNVYSEELKELSLNRKNYEGTRILIDIDPSNLNDSEFVEYLANNLLNKDRMEKIVTKYCNYAGLIRKRINNEGKITFRKDLDSSVINHLSLSKEKRKQEIDEEREIRVITEKEKSDELQEETKNKQEYYKNSIEVDLIKDNRDER